MTQQIAKVHLNKIRVSPRKLNLLMQAIRGKSASDALNFLTFSRKRVSEEARKALLSAIANAENNLGLDIDGLYVQQAYVGSSIKLRRFHPRGRGKGGVIEKPFANLSIFLAHREEA